MVSIETVFDKLISLLKSDSDCKDILKDVEALRKRYMELDNTFICDVCGKEKTNNPKDICNYVGIVTCADCDKKNKED